MRPDWDTYFMRITKLVATRSSCLRRQVGAVLVKDKRILATGYNGAPTNMAHCAEMGCLREQLHVPSGERHELCRGLHAEQNAIIQAGQDRCQNATMYIYGHNFICILCKRFIVQAGIKDVYLKKDDFAQIVHVTVDDIRKELEA